jgi:hypothetical protein
MAGYSGTPLVRKLGIKPDATVAVIGAPAEFRAALGDLPEGARLTSRPSAPADLVICFLRSKAELDARLLPMRELMQNGLWFAWPKKSSGVRTDLTEDVIRAAGLANGLVDYKVCAIDDIWSGLKFARVKGAAARRPRR